MRARLSWLLVRWALRLNPSLAVIESDDLRYYRPSRSAPPDRLVEAMRGLYVVKDE